MVGTSRTATSLTTTGQLRQCHRDWVISGAVDDAASLGGTSAVMTSLPQRPGIASKSLAQSVPSPGLDDDRQTYPARATGLPRSWAIRSHGRGTPGTEPDTPDVKYGRYDGLGGAISRVS
jgi:hypothetical protein